MAANHPSVHAQVSHMVGYEFYGDSLSGETRSRPRQEIHSRVRALRFRLNRS
jgi:hypothetical protein